MNAMNTLSYYVCPVERAVCWESPTVVTDTCVVLLLLYPYRICTSRSPGRFWLVSLIVYQAVG
jgi:hypothetical protein